MTDTAPPTAPSSLPKYLAEGVPKQDDDTLRDLQDYIDALLEYRQQTIAEDELPDEAEPANEEDDEEKGTVVEKMIPCGDETCRCMNGGGKHGPYLYRYYREDGKVVSDYIGRTDE